MAQSLPAVRLFALEIPAAEADEPVLARVACQARAVLDRSSLFDLRNLEVDQERECVVLRGSVKSFYHKQLAQELVKTAIIGVEVINEIRVDYYTRERVTDSDWL